MDMLTNEQAIKAQAFAADFLDQISKAMDGDHKGAGYMAFAGLDKFYDLLTNTDENMGYIVYNHPDNGHIGTDLMMGATLAEWTDILTDPSRFTSKDISFFDVDSSRRSFLIMVAQKVTTNIPKNPADVRLHVLRAIGNVFMGAQFYFEGFPGFQLVYIDLTLEEPLETKDMSSYLVAL